MVDNTHPKQVPPAGEQFLIDYDFWVVITLYSLGQEIKRYRVYVGFHAVGLAAGWYFVLASDKLVLCVDATVSKVHPQSPAAWLMLVEHVGHARCQLHRGETVGPA